MANETVKDSPRIKEGGTKEFMQKLSRGLMLPIAILPIAGLFLGIGAGIENIMIQAGLDRTADAAAFVFPTLIKTIGDVIFGNLPVLFAIGVAIAFTEDAGVAGLSAFVGWIVFNATQSVMIQPNMVDGVQQGFNILWYGGVPASVVGTNVGITSLQTSVFGGLAVGGSVAFLYNKFHTFQMPKVLGFFSGTRFVPIITFLTIPALAFIFLMTWPGIGIGLELLGQSLAAAPAGLDSLAFGYIERILVPFGLHHAFYTPLWYTSAGGTLYDSTGAVLATGNQSIWFEMQTLGISFDQLGGVGSGAFPDPVAIVAPFDSSLSVWELTVGTEVYYITEGVQPGAYLQGKYAFMIFGLPAAGAAMIMAAKGKENREVAMAIVVSAALTSFLTGITEPIEFTFLFLAPWLFFGVHASLAALSFWAMDLLGANVGMTFSGGAIDLVLYGIIPDITNQGAHHYWVYVIGAAYIPIYYFTFYYAITKLDIPTPGRAEGARLYSKADVQAKRMDKKTKSSTRGGPSAERVDLLIENLGGMDNLKSIDACITRLRLTVNDRSKVNDQGLVQMGAAGIVGKTKAIQVVFGAEADIFKTRLKEIRRTSEAENPKPTPKPNVKKPTKKVEKK